MVLLTVEMSIYVASLKVNAQNMGFVRCGLQQHGNVTQKKNVSNVEVFKCQCFLSKMFLLGTSLRNVMFLIETFLLGT